MYTILFIVILFIIVADFLIDRYVDYLNTTRWSDRLPGELEGIYDEKKYAQQQAYHRENHRFGLLTSTFNFALVVGMLVFFGFAWLNSVVFGWTASSVLAALLFFGVLMMSAEVVNLPFSWYDTFVIEEKYGFNQSSVRTFVLDKLKGWVLTMMLGGALLALIVWLYSEAGSWFWVVAWAVLSGFSVFMAMFYSSLIVPLFNKQTPLGEGELRTAIEEFSGKVGFRIDNIFVIDGSRRSTKANAYFTGLGSKKRIVLYDTLINEMTTEEVVAVLAHEIGHYKKRHIVQGLVLGIAQTGLLLFLFSVVMKSPAVSQALGVEQPNFHIGMIAFSILYSPLSMVTGLAMNRLSRKNEFEADAFAAENFGPAPLITALKKLSVKNLSNLTPHPVYVFFNYSHPPLLQRLEHLHKFENR